MTYAVIICPPASAAELRSEEVVPHPGLGWVELYRNGILVWDDLDGSWLESEPRWTMAMLSEWCPVRQGVGWKLRLYGPMKDETYKLRRGRWVLTERGMGFA